MRPRLAVCVIALLLSGVALDFGLHRVLAAEPPDIAALRAQLERVRSEHEAQLPEGAWLTIEYTIDVAERIAKGFSPQAAIWRKRAQDFMAAAAQGRDAVVEQRGKLIMRGYRSPISRTLQGYGIYLPPNYDPSRAYPLLIMLHGGSANGNLFLGVVLGNNMNWKEYDIHLWDEYAPRFVPDWIVVAPDGFGQVMWRFMGEQDVLDVIADVQRHYHVDPDRIALGGLSNGGVGAYNLGMRHASMFSTVQAIAGAPSWLQYSGGNIPEEQRAAMIPQSGMQLAENAINTDFRYYHGRTDTGPMKPRFVEELTRVITPLGVPFKETWYDAGHDLLYLVHRHGKIYADLEPLRRKRNPSEVRVVTGDYRANVQHWVTVTRIEGYPALARVRAVAQGDAIAVEAKGARAFALDLRQAPLAATDQLAISVNGKEAYRGPRAPLGHVVNLVATADGYHLGFPPEPVPGALAKKPGLSGPITDAYYGAMLHVYGTADATLTDVLKRTAERGAQGWPLWLWRVAQPVVADTELTDELARTHNLVLYGTPGSNRVLERIAAALPIKIEPGAVVVGARRIEGKQLGTRFIYPSPLAKDRYVIVQAAASKEGISLGHNLPDFLPDYVVYDGRSAGTRPRLAFSKGNLPPAMGYFDDQWRLPGADAAPSGSDATGTQPAPPSGPTGALEPPAAETLARDASPAEAAAAAAVAPNPPVVDPAALAASERTQAGKAARLIAKRVQSFVNYRSKIPHATWTVDEGARWSIRDDVACLADLRAQGIPFHRYVGPDLSTPVATPVEVDGPIGGVTFRMIHQDRTLLISCELVARLPAIAAVLRKHGVRSAAVISAYRNKPHDSFHTFGLALDMWRFTTDKQTLSVLQHFEITDGIPTCAAPRARTPEAQTLREIACDLAATHKLSSVLTPNYNVGHRDHFHVDIRPDDPRLFLR